jgi:hypothetical protein
MLSVYPKPKKFSDPFQDWMGCEETLDGILAKDIDELGLSDYNVIFYMILPAASYEEGAYYLDGCFNFMMHNPSAVESNICEGLFWFIDYHRDALRADGILDLCLKRTVALLQDYLSLFELMRLSDAELTRYCIRQDFREIPKRSNSVGDLLDSLVEYELYSAVLSDILAWLNEDAVYHKSCWWIEIAYHVRWWYVTYDADDQANQRRQHLINRLLDLHNYSSHEWRHRDFVRGQGYEQYERRISLT